jgi:hypothetical protein
MPERVICTTNMFKREDYCGISSIKGMQVRSHIDLAIGSRMDLSITLVLQDSIRLGKIDMLVLEKDVPTSWSHDAAILVHQDLGILELEKTLV